MTVKHIVKPLMALTLLLSACDTSLPANNPYDPDVPAHQKEPGALSGTVSLEAATASAATIEVRPVGKYAAPDLDGSFEVRDLPPGSYSVRVSAPGHVTQTRSGLFVAAGQSVDIGTVDVLAIRGGVTGLVRLMRDPENEADSHGGALVHLRPSVDGGAISSEHDVTTVTNPDGSWTVTGLPLGAYSLDGSKDQYAPSPPVDLVLTEEGISIAPTMVLRAITGVVKINDKDEFTNDADVMVEVVAFNTDEMQISEDPQFTGVDWEPHLAERPFTLTGEDGEKTVFMRFRNHDGYLTQAMHDSIVLDRAAPVGGSVAIAGNEMYVTDATVGLALHAQDALSGVAEMLVAIDGTIDDETWVPYEPHRTVTLPVGPDPDGEVATVAVQFKDGAGNETLAVQGTVIVDSVAPQAASIVIDDGAALTASRVVTLTLSAQGATEMMLGNDSGLIDGYWQPYVSSLGWGLTDGDELKTVFVRFRDAAGNLSATVEDSIELNTKGTVSGVFLLEGAAAGGHAGIDVSLSTDPVTTGTTDAAGAVSFTEVPVGLYSARATHAGYRQTTVPLFAVDPGQIADIGQHTLTRARGDLIGLALREDGAAGEHGAILVEVVGFDDDTTSADGTWIVRNIPVGQVTVRAVAEGYGAAQATDVNVIAEQETTVPDLVLPANPGSVSGLVALEGRTAPNLDGVTILVAGQSAVSAGDGSFLVPGVPAGTHPLTASLAGFGTLNTVVSVDAGQDEDAGTLSLKIARGAVEGRATLAGASDHSGVTVELDGTGYAGLSSGTGNYRIESVPIGTYSLTARKDEYVPKSAGNLTVLEGETVIAADVELVRQSGDFDIEERATGDRDYLNDPAVTLRFGTVPPDSAQILISEDSGFAGATWEGFSGLTHDYDLTSADGTVTVFVKFKDTFDQESPVLLASAVLDRVAPLDTSTVTIDSGAAWATDPDVSLTLVGVDETSGVEFMTISLDGTFDTETDEGFKATVTRTLESATDGLKAVWVEYVDRAGNRSAAPVTDTIYLDRAAPGNDTIAINGGVQYATDALVTLALTAEDACTADYPTGGCVGGIVDPAQMMLSNEPGFPGAGWEALSASRVWFLTPGDGTKRVHVKFRDGAGNESNPIWSEIELDRTPPQSPRVEILDGAVIGAPQVDLSLSANPEPFEMIVAEGGDFGSASWVAFSGTLDDFALSADDGLKTVTAKFRDAAGNESVVASDTVLLDQQAPNGSLTIVEGEYVLAASATLSITASTDVVRMCVYGDVTSACDPGSDPTGWAVFDSGPAVNLTAAEGAKTVTVVLADAAGNKSAAISAGTFFDAAPPAGTTITVSGTSHYDRVGDAPVDVPMDDDVATMTTAVSLTLAAADSGSGVTAMLLSNNSLFSGAVWRPYETAVDLWALTGGAADYENRVVYAKFRDAAGRESATYIEDGILLDNVAPIAPSLSIESGAAQVAGTTADVTLSATGADFRQLSTDPGFGGEPWAVFVSPETVNNYDLGGEGTRTVYARFRDEVGNLSSLVNDSILADASAPANASVLIDGGAEFSTAANGQVTLTLHAEDGLSGVDEMRFSNNGTAWDAWVPYSTSFGPWTLASPTNRDDVVRTVHAEFRDHAGNTTTAVTDTIRLDNVAPTIDGAGLQINGSDTYTTDAVVSLTLPATGAYQMKITSGNGCGSGAWQQYGSPVTWTLAGGDDEVRWVSAIVRDEAGNQSGCGTDSITVDTVAPIAESITIDGCAVDVGGTCEGMGGGGDGGHDPFFSNDEYVGVSVGVNGSCAEIHIAWTADFSVERDVHACGTSFPVVDLIDDTADGPKTLYARAIDAAGNTSNTVQAQVNFDGTQPQFGSVSIEGGVDFTDQTVVDLSIHAEDLGSGMFWMFLDLDNQPANGVSAAYAPLYSGYALPPPYGATSVYMMFEDLAGNFTAAPSTISDSIFVDTKLPQVPSISRLCSGGQDPASCPAIDRTNNTAVLVVLDAADVADQDEQAGDGGSGVFEVKIASGDNASDALAAVAWQPYSSGITHVLDSTNGEQSVWVATRDRVGRSRQAAVPALITLDTEPPFGHAISFGTSSPPGRAYTQSQSIKTGVTVQDNLDAPDELTVLVTGDVAMIDGDPSLPGSETGLPLVDDLIWQFTPFQGPKTAYLEVRDRALNWTVTQAEATIIVDTQDPTPPTIVFTQGGNRSVEVYWSGGGDAGYAGAGLSAYRINWGTSPGTYTDSLDVGPTETWTTVTGLDNDQRYYFAVESVDLSGRTAASGEASQLTGWRSGTIISRPNHLLTVEDLVIAGPSIYVLYTDCVSTLCGVWLARSDDEGATWDHNPVSLDVQSNRLVGGMAVTGEDIVVAFSYKFGAPNPEKVIMTPRSQDNGVTWQYGSDLATDLDWAACAGTGHRRCMKLNNHSGILSLVYWRDEGADDATRLVTRRDPDFAWSSQPLSGWEIMATGDFCDTNTYLLLVGVDTDEDLEVRWVRNLDQFAAAKATQTDRDYLHVGMDCLPSDDWGVQYGFVGYVDTSGEVGLKRTANLGDGWARYVIDSSGSKDWAPAVDASGNVVSMLYLDNDGKLMLARADGKATGTWRIDAMTQGAVSGPLMVDGYAGTTLFGVYSNSQRSSLEFLTSAVNAPRIEAWNATSGSGPQAGIAWHPIGDSDQYRVFNDTVDPPVQSFLTGNTSFQAEDTSDPFFSVAAVDGLGQAGQPGAVWEVAAFEADSRAALPNGHVDEPDRADVAVNDSYAFYLPALDTLELERYSRSTGTWSSYTIDDTATIGARAIAIAGSDVFVLYRAEPSGSTEVRVKRSSNNGVSWTPAMVLDNTDVTGRSLDLVSDGVSRLAAAWTDLNTALFTTKIRVQTYNGTLWSSAGTADASNFGGDDFVRLAYVSSNEQTIKLAFEEDNVIRYAYTSNHGTAWSHVDFPFIGTITDLDFSLHPSSNVYHVITLIDRDARAAVRLRAIVAQGGSSDPAMWSHVVIDEDMQGSTNLDNRHVAAVSNGNGIWILYTPNTVGELQETRLAYCRHDCAGPDGWNTGPLDRRAWLLPFNQDFLSPVLAADDDDVLFGGFLKQNGTMFPSNPFTNLEALLEGRFRRTWQ